MCHGLVHPFEMSPPRRRARHARHAPLLLALALLLGQLDCTCNGETEPGSEIEEVRRTKKVVIVEEQPLLNVAVPDCHITEADKRSDLDPQHSRQTCWLLSPNPVFDSRFAEWNVLT